MRAWSIAVVALTLLSSGCIDAVWGTQEPDEEVMAYLEEMSQFPEWRLETNHGTIRAILYTGWMPMTTGHIIQLTERGFYNGTLVHRVVDDFVLQGGDSSCGATNNLICTGEGGSGPFGNSADIPLEIAEQGLDFGSGAIGLARWTDDTGDSQYFIMEKPSITLSQPSADDPVDEVLGAYALWAQVFEGFDVVRDIADNPVDANDRPNEDVVVSGAAVLPPPADVDLLNLIPNVHGGISTQGHEGYLEIPRFLVADHPFAVHFSTDSGQACNLQQWVLRGPEGDGFQSWTVDGVDSCTFETTLMLDAGEYVIDLGTDEVALNVLPWSDAYEPYTGTDKTGI